MTWECGRCRWIELGCPGGEIPKHFRTCRKRAWCASADLTPEEVLDPTCLGDLSCLAPETCNAPINYGAAWHRGEVGFPHHPPCACSDCVSYYGSLK